MTLLLAAIVDLTIILAVGLLATVLMRGRSAALRHWILAVAIVAGAAAPVLELVLPQWPVPLISAVRGAVPELASTLRFTSEAPPLPAEAAAVPAPTRWPWAELLVVGWVAGALVGLLGLGTGLLRLARFSARCIPVRTGPWRESADLLASQLGLRRVEILQSANPSLLVTWGLVTPKIILPAGASTWTEPRRRVVLAHEMAHIRRRDWLLQMSAEALRAVHWVNPLAWLACRRLRQESEYACDDAVLSGGVAPTEYATHLLDVARQAIGHRSAWVSAPAIAHPSTLERRIAAMLTEKRNREPLTRRASAAAVAGIVAVALPVTALAVSRVTGPVTIAPDVVLAAQVVTETVAPRALPPPVRPTPVAPRNRVAPAAAQQAPATISVVVQDASGGILPGVEAMLTDAQFGLRYRAVSDGTGRFAFRELQPGRYDLVLSLPGFATVRNVMTVTAGADVQRTMSLPLGSLAETVSVGCATPAADLSPSMPDIVVDRQAGVAYVNGERYTRRTASAFDLVMTARSLTRPPAVAAFAQDRPAARPVRVGGMIRVPNPLRRVNPVCPSGVVAGDTTVVLVGRIGVDGYMNEVNQVPPAPGEPAPLPEFVDSALDAVRQWTFTPTQLNNVPVEVNITVRVLYQRR